MRQRNEAAGAARSGFFGAQRSTGVAAGNGFLAADLAGHRLIGAAAIASTDEQASRFGDPGTRHPGPLFVRRTKQA
jgi:hypothetical protein